MHFDGVAQVGPDLMKSYENTQLFRDRGRIPGREGGWPAWWYGPPHRSLQTGYGGSPAVRRRSIRNLVVFHPILIAKFEAALDRVEVGNAQDHAGDGEIAVLGGRLNPIA